jgi:hypothetical protein
MSSIVFAVINWLVGASKGLGNDRHVALGQFQP